MEQFFGTSQEVDLPLAISRKIFHARIFSCPHLHNNVDLHAEEAYTTSGSQFSIDELCIFLAYNEATSPWITFIICVILLQCSKINEHFFGNIRASVQKRNLLSSLDLDSRWNHVARCEKFTKKIACGKLNYPGAHSVMRKDFRKCTFVNIAYFPEELSGSSKKSISRCSSTRPGKNSPGMDLFLSWSSLQCELPSSGITSSSSHSNLCWAQPITGS